MSRFSKAWLPAMAGPVFLAAAAVAVALGPDAITTRFWPTLDTNMAEAAFMRDTARMRLLARQGVALDRSYPVRAKLLDSDTWEMTPLEAARKSGSAEVLQLLEALLAARAEHAP